MTLMKAVVVIAVGIGNNYNGFQILLKYRSKLLIILST